MTTMTTMTTMLMPNDNANDSDSGEVDGGADEMDNEMMAMMKRDDEHDKDD